MEAPIIEDHISRSKYRTICDHTFKHGKDQELSGVVACRSVDLGDLPEFDGKVVSVWDDPPVVRSIANKLYATNVCIDDASVVSIPLGRDFRTSRAAVNFTPKDQLNSKLMYVNFAYDYPIEGVNEGRKRAFISHYNKPWVTAIKVGIWNQYPINGDEFLQHLHTHKFTLSPEGCGVDCFRTWDALYMKSIPIVKHSLHMDRFSDLPIMFVDDYAELDEELLEDTYSEMLEKEYNFELLEFSYWRDLIKC